jgi:hypothetical protein
MSMDAAGVNNALCTWGFDEPCRLDRAGRGFLVRLLAFVVLALGAFSSALAIDVGWMQTGVRAWYFGGVKTGVPTSSDTEEAFLLGPINGSSVDVTHHAAINHWSSPQPVITQTYSLQDQGPIWIHPQVLQTIDKGDYWMGQQITSVIRSPYTWATFPYHTLPINALFDRQPQREIVRLSYVLPLYSVGTAYFDAETGIALYYDRVWPTALMFGVLSEINYDFERHVAFAEDDGPHTGYHSWASERSQGNLISGGGMVDIHSQVESRYASTVEMWVITNLTGPNDFKPQAYENYAFFGAIPQVTHIAHDQAGSVRPEQWAPFGHYLWWWVPPGVTGLAAAGANGFAASDANVLAVAVPTIDVLDVSMDRTADFPITYTATESPLRFHFTSLTFGDDGYLQVFSAKDPTIGLDVKPTDFNFQNQNVVYGPSYFRRSMTDDAFPPGGQVPSGWSKPTNDTTTWAVANDASYKGSMSLKSVDIGDGQTAAIEVSGRYLAGNVTFAARVSSEQGHDVFEFYIDGKVQTYGWGNIDWTLLSFPVDADEHTFTWRYTKNGSVSSGSDAAWIDSVVLPPAVAPMLTGVVSRKVHGATGTFDLPLNLVSTNPTTEPRSGGAGGNHTIVFVFDKPVTAGNASVIAGVGTAGTPNFSGTAMIVPLSGATNQQYVTVSVSDVVSADGGAGGSGSVRVGFLLGDVSQNRVVTVSDLAQVNAQIAQVVTPSNYLKDVNASGTLTVADKGIANTQITKALPAP